MGLLSLLVQNIKEEESWNSIELLELRIEKASGMSHYSYLTTHY